MVDKDHRQAYSDIISLRSDCTAPLLIAPNPVQTVLTISGLQAGHQVVVVNTTGQQVARELATGSVLFIDSRAWVKGLYMATELIRLSD